MIAAMLALLLTMSPMADAGWRPDTQAARIWLKQQMPRRQWRCLDELWSNESGWRVLAGHPRRAYGIPQAYPGRKMGSAGPDWRTNAMTQVRWGIHYVRGRYGRPCAALRFQSRHGWY